MKTILIQLLAIGAAVPLMANEALDILENNQQVDQLEVPTDTGELEGETLDDSPVVFVPKEWEASPHLDNIWSRAVLYENESNPWIQQLAISGLYEFGGSWGNAEVDNAPNVSRDTTRTRRARLGARMKIFGNTEIEAVGEFAGEVNYQRLERLKARTYVLPHHYVELGKYRPTFGIEQSKEPHELLTPERTFLANMLMPSSTLGISIGQDCKPWDWSVGWFSADAERYMPRIASNGFIVANLAYEGAERLEDGQVMRTRWHLDYIHNMDDRSSETIPRYNAFGQLSANGNQFVRSNPSYRHLVSTGVDVEGDRVAFEADFQLANGDTNVWGMTITPSYWAVPGTLRIVGRYHYADTDDAGGIVGGIGAGSDPFFNSDPIFIGDELHTFYLGANVHLYQDKMVILNGLEYTLLKDEAGGGFDTNAWIWHTGARVSF